MVSHISDVIIVFLRGLYNQTYNITCRFVRRVYSREAPSVGIRSAGTSETLHPARSGGGCLTAYRAAEAVC